MTTRWLMVLVLAVAIAAAARVAPSPVVLGLVVLLAGSLAFLLGRDPDSR